jgi:sulfopyruvate decarboxylase TPP-binding subunit
VAVLELAAYHAAVLVVVAVGHHFLEAVEASSMLHFVFQVPLLVAVVFFQVQEAVEAAVPMSQQCFAIQATIYKYKIKT